MVVDPKSNVKKKAAREGIGEVSPRTVYDIRLSIKKSLFPVDRPGG